MDSLAITSITTVREGAAVQVDVGHQDVLVLVALTSDGNAFVVPGSSFPVCPAAETWLAAQQHVLDRIEQGALEQRQYDAWSAARAVSP